MLPTALDDIRVLDISQGIAGPLCARILGDFGADVIKVEPSSGERGRSLPPFHDNDPHPEKSLFFLLLNLNKRGVTLNLETNKGQSMFKELVREADVVIESYAPGYLASLGLDHASLERENPGIVMTSITPFGQSGPYSGYKGEEIVTYAMSGIMAISGTTDREPLRHGGVQSQYESGLNGALATAFALLLRDFTDEGQHVDVSMQEVVASTMVIEQPFYPWNGGVRGRRNPEGAQFSNIMPCKDGYFISQPGGGATWEQIADFYRREELKEPRFAEADQRSLHGPEMDEIILEATSDRTMAEMFKEASEDYRMLFGIAQTPEDLADCPQLESRDFYWDVDHPVIGKTKVPSRLFNMTEIPSSYRIPAPLLGQHNLEVYEQGLGYSRDDVVRLRELYII